MLKGRIKSINSTKYLVDVNDTIYDCTVRGIFRKRKLTPLVGDYVEINEKDLQIVEIIPRNNFLKRPNIANVDYAVIITSIKKPDLDLNLLDKMLVMINAYNVKPIICFSKIDLLTQDEYQNYLKIKDYYKNIGIKVLDNTEIDELKKTLSGKVATLCGQTGAGKSSLLNKIDGSLGLETNPISESLNRGVHTTRYVSLYKIEDFYIADTPGFSSLTFEELDEETIRSGFIEFQKYDCAYRDCSHINTDGCKIENNNDILASRYTNYVKFIKEYHENSSKLFKKW